MTLKFSTLIHITITLPTICYAYEYGVLQLEPSFFAALSIIFGLPLSFSGYKHLSSSILACSFIYGGLLAYLLVNVIITNGDEVPPSFISWFCFIIIGLVTSVIASKSVLVGLCLTGSAAGSLIGVIWNTVLIHRLHSNDPDTGAAIVIPVLSLVGGYAVFQHQRKAVIVATSFIGAFSFVWGIGYFLKTYPGGMDLSRLADDTNTVNVPTVYYRVYLPLTFVLTIIGVGIQTKWTAVGVQYYHVGPKRRPDGNLDAQDVGFRFSRQSDSWRGKRPFLQRSSTPDVTTAVDST